MRHWAGDIVEQVIFEGENHGFAFALDDGLDLKKIGTEIKGALDVIGLHGISQHHDGEVLNILGAEPFQNFKASLERHLQIEQEEIRQGIFGAVAEFRVALKIGDGFAAIGDFRDDFQTRGAAHGFLQKEAIIFRIIRDQYQELFFSVRNHDQIIYNSRLPKLKTEGPPIGYNRNTVRRLCRLNIR
jgi:hypothetical protein